MIRRHPEPKAKDLCARPSACKEIPRSARDDIVGAVLALSLIAAAHGEPRRSGFDFMAPATQAMQRDDLQNPGMFAVQDGDAVWRRKAGARAQACADCHADDTMKGVAARYPAFDAGERRAIDLRTRIRQCRERRQQAAPWPPEHAELLALEAWLGHRSRGMPLAPPDDRRLQPHRDAGERLYTQRFGQLNLACAQCHDGHAGGKLAGSTIPQAHPTGYPVYRLEWQGVGSLQRRIRGCMTGVRAEPYAWGAQELIDLEAYLAWRARGMPIETPAVRP